MSINRGIDKNMWYIYIYPMEYYSATKRNKAEPAAEMQWNLESVIQSEGGRKEKTRYSDTNAYIWNLERRSWWTCLQGRNRGADGEKRRQVDTAAEGEGGANRESSAEIYTRPCVRQTDRGKLGCSPGSLARGSLTTWMEGWGWVGGSRGSGYMDTCSWFTLLYSRNQHRIM